MQSILWLEALGYLTSMRYENELVLRKLNQCKVNWKFNFMPASADYFSNILCTNECCSKLVIQSRQKILCCMHASQLLIARCLCITSALPELSARAHMIS